MYNGHEQPWSDFSQLLDIKGEMRRMLLRMMTLQRKTAWKQIAITFHLWRFFIKEREVGDLSFGQDGPVLPYCPYSREKFQQRRYIESKSASSLA